MSDTPSNTPAPAPAPVPAPTPASTPAAPKKLFGAHPGVIALALFVVAGLVFWLTGAFDGLFSKSGHRVVDSSDEVVVRTPTPQPKGLNINTATAEEMMKELGLKQEVVDAIIAKRPFKNFQAVLKVKGIGQKKLDKLRPKIRLY